MSLLKSSELYLKYRTVSPSGVQSNIRYEEPHPLYFQRAAGSKMWDLDGNEYLDCIAGMGTIILGHNDQSIREEMINVLDSGLTAGVETELSYNVAKTMCEMIPSAEMVRFANSGTEAIMHSIMIARGYTGRRKIVKIEGGYDGWYDQVAYSHHPSIEKAGSMDSPVPVPDSKGIVGDSNTLVVPFNDITNLTKTLGANENDIAAIIVEPVCYNMGAVLPHEGYLSELRDLATKKNIVLIFDEVISGFRVAPGGAQQFYNVRPDLSTFAKAMANGFPVGAIAGRKDLMETAGPKGGVSYGGMYNGNQISLAAAKASLAILKSGDVQDYLRKCTEILISSMGEISNDTKIPVRLQGLGGQFQVYFTDKQVFNYRDVVGTNKVRYSQFSNKLREQAVLFHRDQLFHHGITRAHTQSDIRVICNSFRIAIESIKNS